MFGKRKSARTFIGLAIGCVFSVAAVPSRAQVDVGGAAFSLAKDTTVITSPLHTDGTPDYIAALNEKYSQGVTPDNNGFVLWLEIAGSRNGTTAISEKIRPQVLAALKVSETPADAQLWQVYGAYLQKQRGFSPEKASEKLDEVVQARLKLWSANDYPDLAAHLAYQDKLLDKAHQAATRPKWWSPSFSADGRTMVNVLLPSLGSIRDITSILCARATFRANAGDFDGFLADVIAVKQLARHLANGWTMIDRLVGYAIDRTANDAIATVAGSGKLTQSQCAALGKALDTLPELGDMAGAVDVGERWGYLDLTMLVATGGETLQTAGETLQKLFAVLGLKPADARLVFLAGIDRSAVNWDFLLRRLNGTVDDMVAIAREPRMTERARLDTQFSRTVRDWTAEINSQPSPAKDQAESREAYSERVLHVIATLTLANPGNAAERYREAQMHGQMARTIVALADARAKTGQWPAKLDQLTPALLKQIPTDMYSPGERDPVKYFVTDHGPKVYSIGKNQTDDNGQRNAQQKQDDVAIGPG